MKTDATKPFVIDFDLQKGFCPSGLVKPTSRYVSNMKNQFKDAAAAEAAIKNGDPLLYQFYGMETPEEKGGLSMPPKPGGLYFGTTILYPGTVGDEYYMTKGHFHTILDTAEVYYTLSGHGMMVMETPEGDTDVRELKPGDCLYVAGRWAHRSVNIGNEPLILFFTYPTNAGHDYGTIEENGYRKLVVKRDGKPVIIDNPKWD